MSDYAEFALNAINVVADLQAEIKLLRKELAAAQKDAERLRRARRLGWILAPNESIDAEWQRRGDATDAAIDAAMAQEKRDE